MSRRFVRMFKPRFARLVESGAKRQTIRPTPKRIPQPGDILDAREWTGKPYRSKQRKLREFKISRVSEIGISIEGIDEGEWPMPDRFIDGFARADGFNGWAEMREWFEAEHGLPFTGILIEWE